MYWHLIFPEKSCKGNCQCKEESHQKEDDKKGSNRVHGSLKANLNIAKGTTDPRVEFILPK